MFKLSENFIEKWKTVKPPFGFNGAGELTYMRTYSRLQADKTNERWWETVRRVVEGTYSMQKRWIDLYNLGWNPWQAQKSAQEMYERIFMMKFLPPGRGLWAMGTDLTEKKGLYAALNNCSFVSTENLKNDHSKPFTFLMDASMLGVGVGFDTRGAGSILVKGIDRKKSTLTFVIPDTREGWVESVGLIIDSYFTGGNDYIFDYSLIRPAGTPIKGFGGVASGPEPLEELHNAIRRTLDNNTDEPITITSIVDIMNFIGKCVVAGNVRRCLPKGTLIHTNNGLIPIENIDYTKDKASTTNGYMPISELVHQGVQTTLGIETQLGIFECTPRHKIAVLTSPSTYSWKMAKDLKENDRLVFPITPTIGGNTSKLPEYEYDKPKHSTTCQDITIPKLDHLMSYFLGNLHGDGCVQPNFEQNGFNAYVSIACCPYYLEIARLVKKQMERFGVNVTLNEKSSNGAAMVRAQSKQLAWYLSKFKTSNTSIDVPTEILKGTFSQRAGYLAGLFDADGSAKNRPTTLVSSIYPNYLKQVQAIYASLGIPSRLKLHRPAIGSWKDLYTLSLVGERATKQFELLVAPYSLKYKHTAKTKRSQNDYGFPAEWCRDLDYTNKWNPSSEQMTTSTYERCGGNLAFTPIKVIAIHDNMRKVDTYDISVPGANEFFAQEGLLVHNTAEIVFGDPYSDEYIDLKNPMLFPEALESHRWASNNSIFAEIGMDYEPSSNRTRLNGEPGYAWLENMRAFSRMKDKPDWKDKRVMGGNPCLEQSLESYELCCLVETFPVNHNSLEDYVKTLKYAYLYAKTVTLGNTQWAETNRVALRNRRIGTSVSGVVDFIAKNNIETLRHWLETGYKAVQDYDEMYSEWLAVPRSIKTTSVKPSGCLVPSTEIRTSEGVMSLYDIFLENGVDLGKKTEEYREWYPLSKEMYVKDENNDLQKITKLFVNGFEETIKFLMEDNTIIECTPLHKFKMTDGTWKQAKDITEKDDFILQN